MSQDRTKRKFSAITFVESNSPLSPLFCHPGGGSGFAKNTIFEALPRHKILPIRLTRRGHSVACIYIALILIQADLYCQDILLSRLLIIWVSMGAVDIYRYSGVGLVIACQFVTIKSISIRCRPDLAL